MPLKLINIFNNCFFNRSSPDQPQRLERADPHVLALVLEAADKTECWKVSRGEHDRFPDTPLELFDNKEVVRKFSQKAHNMKISNNSSLLSPLRRIILSLTIFLNHHTSSSFIKSI